jgi:endonuclease III
MIAIPAAASVSLPSDPRVLKVPSASQRRTIEVLVERYGQTFAEEVRVDVAKGTPSPLFRLLVLSILLSARIRHRLAADAARALFEQGWTTAQKLDRTTWEQRVRVLNRAGYARYDERTASMLGDTSATLLDRYRGDLRRLRTEADREPERERVLLKQFKGLGDVGVDIFFREVQVAWEELRPFADRRALDAAGKLGLPTDARALQRLVGNDAREFARLVAALVRVRLDRDVDAVRELASS